MTALIITETCFGNTAQIADAIAEALAGSGDMAVDSVAAEDAPPTVPPEVQLLVLAAPTHDYSLPRASTRQRARRRGPARSQPIGLREWIAAAPPAPGLKTVTVDTALHSGFMPSTAAKTAAKLLRKAGFSDARRGATFFVTDCAGPLEEGEAVRARAWAATLAAGLRAAEDVRSCWL
jgi:hypothetical protein